MNTASTLERDSLTARAREIESELSAAGVPPVLTAEQAAEALGLEHPRTIARMVCRGELSGFCVGRRHRIRRGALALFIAKREAEN